MTIRLNDSAAVLVQQLLEKSAELEITHSQLDNGVTIIDLGISVSGSLAAGISLAEICIAGQGHVTMVPLTSNLPTAHAVTIESEHPLAACMASQYAGWKIATDDFFGMGSGPMRAAAGSEEIYQHIGCIESASHVVGVIESSSIPTTAACELIIAACQIEPQNLTLLVAPTSSLAGTVQIVARSLETAMHKMHELGFDLHRVERGTGTAPLCPLGQDDLLSIGLTNDAILYGGEAEIWVRGDDSSLNDIGPKIPSNASADYGRPFVDIFRQYNNDFYKIDPHLFSPATIRINNVDTGNTFCFGEINSAVLIESFNSAPLSD
jgi:methenyltetrahydromethanopterin cyclohydrolase